MNRPIKEDAPQNLFAIDPRQLLIMKLLERSGLAKPIPKNVCRATLTAAFLALALHTGASAADLAGRASVIDGDTIEITGKRIRLWGMDAPESTQTCKTAAGAEWRCGRDATYRLDSMLRGKVVYCNQRDTDRYGRMVAQCSIDRRDVGGAMVEAGFAVPYRMNRYYDGRMEVAKRAKAGMWSGSFIMPWDWRAGVR